MPTTYNLPWPPSVNGYWRTFRNRQIISKRGRDYRNEAIAEVLEQGRKKHDGRLRTGVGHEEGLPLLGYFDRKNENSDNTVSIAAPASVPRIAEPVRRLVKQV